MHRATFLRKEAETTAIINRKSADKVDKQARTVLNQLVCDITTYEEKVSNACATLLESGIKVDVQEQRSQCMRMEWNNSVTYERTTLDVEYNKLDARRIAWCSENKNTTIDNIENLNAATFAEQFDAHQLHHAIESNSSFDIALFDGYTDISLDTLSYDTDRISATANNEVLPYTIVFLRLMSTSKHEFHDALIHAGVSNSRADILSTDAYIAQLMDIDQNMFMSVLRHAVSALIEKTQIDKYNLAPYHRDIFNMIEEFGKHESTQIDELCKHKTGDAHDGWCRVLLRSCAYGELPYYTMYGAMQDDTAIRLDELISTYSKSGLHSIVLRLLAWALRNGKSGTGK